MQLAFELMDAPDEACRAHWNDRIAVHDLSLDIDYLAVVAQATPQARYQYLRGTDSTGRLVCLACFSVTPMAVARFATLRILVLGGMIASGKAFWFDETLLDFTGFLDRFEAFVRAAVPYDVMVLKEFLAGTDDALLRATQAAGFINLMCFDRSRLPLPADGQLQSYLDTLPSKKRRQLRNIQAQSTEAGLAISVSAQFAGVIDTLYPLYLAVNQRASEARTPALPHALFAGLSQQVAAARLLSVTQHGKMIGFGLLLQRGAQLKCMVIGLDYAVSRELQLWYLIVLESIAHALASGCTHVDLGSTNHAMKRKLGAQRQEVWIAVRHRHRWLTRWLAPLIRSTVGAIYSPRQAPPAGR